RDTLDVNNTAIGHQCRPFHDILEFAKVPMPHILLEYVFDLRRESLDVLTQLLIRLLEEVVGKNHNIIDAFPKRRHIDLKFIKPVIQVFPELSTTAGIP